MRISYDDYPIKIIIVFTAIIILILLSQGSLSQTSNHQPNTESAQGPISEIANNAKWTASVMFSSRDRGYLAEAIKSYKTKIPIEVLLPNIFPKSGTRALDNLGLSEEINGGNPADNAGNEIISEFPIIYINSILFISPTNWSIWINSKKISYGDQNVQVKPRPGYKKNKQKTASNSTLKDTNISANKFDGKQQPASNNSNDDKLQEMPDIKLEVLNVSEKEAIILWRQSELDRFFPHWRDSLEPIEGTNKYTNKQRNLVLDSASGNITFILKENQSLVGSIMQIAEGEVKIVKAKSSNSGNSSGQHYSSENKRGPLYKKMLEKEDSGNNKAISTKQKDRLEMLESVLDQ